VTYFRYARSHNELRGLDGWLRRKLRGVRLKQCKQPAALRRVLGQHGVSPLHARQLASPGRGWWCLANSPQAKVAMNIAWFDQQGLINLTARHTALNAQRNRRGDPYARWCQRGDREEPSYSMPNRHRPFAGVTGRPVLRRTCGLVGLGRTRARLRAAEACAAAFADGLEDDVEHRDYE
jgi:hypothetical protein